jgi:hypothetical protein
MKKGWNTWNVRSVLSHVSLPEGAAISLGVKDYSAGYCLREALIGRRGDTVEQIIPGYHAYDGSYTCLTLTWRHVKLVVETAVQDQDWYALVTPLQTGVKTEALTIEGAVLWNRPGFARREQDRLIIQAGDRVITVQTSESHRDEPVTEISSPYLLVALDQPVSISTRPEKLAETEKIVQKKKEAFLANRQCYADQQEVYDAMQSCLAWDTIYDPSKDRTISPVSRIWSCDAGGWVLFDWDTYFAAWMAGFEHKELAYANATAITEEVTKQGFIPNFAHPSGFKSRDRSQPPVGSITVKALCDRFDETILAEQLLDTLLGWNRWWSENRDKDGYLCWGSNRYEPVIGNKFETLGVGTAWGAALESGLDNSPMYDDIPFDSESHLLLLGDVGLMSLYIADCDALADLAENIGRSAEAAELRARADRYAKKLKGMWSEEHGLFLNKNLVTGDYPLRLSPTHFYALITGVTKQGKAERMICENFFKNEEFWGEWIMPSIARNDPAYSDQDYWRGRIWAPMNFLVYLGIRKYNLPQARTAIVEKSKALLLKEWRTHGHVHENYCANTGEGCNKENSDPFYHWGGLLGLIALLDMNEKI